MWFRAAIKARAAGLSVAEANARADAETERAAEHIARVDAETDVRVRAEGAARARSAPLPPRSGGEGSGVGGRS